MATSLDLDSLRSLSLAGRSPVTSMDSSHQRDPLFSESPRFSESSRSILTSVAFYSAGGDALPISPDLTDPGKELALKQLVAQTQSFGVKVLRASPRDKQFYLNPKFHKIIVRPDHIDIQDTSANRIVHSLQFNETGASETTLSDEAVDIIRKAREIYGTSLSSATTSPDTSRPGSPVLSHSSTVDDLGGQIEELEGQRDGLDEEIRAREAHIQELEQEFQRLQVIVQQGRQIVADLERDIPLLRQQKAALEREIDGLTRTRNTLNDEIVALRQTRDQLTRDNQVLDTEKQRLEQANRQLQQEIQAHRQTKSDLEETLRLLNDKITGRGKVHKQLLQDIDANQAKLAALQRDIDALEAKQKELTTQNRLKTDANAALDQQAAQLGLDLKALGARKEALMRELEGKERDKAALEATIRGLEQQVAPLERRKAALETDIQLLLGTHATVEALRAELDRTVLDRDAKQATIYQNTQRIRQLEGDLAALDESSQAEIAQLKEEIASLRAELEAARETLEANAREIQSLREQVASLLQDNKRLKSDLRDRDIQIFNLGEALGDRDAEISDLRERLESLEEEAATGRESVREAAFLSDQLRLTEEELAGAEASLADKVKLIGRLQSEKIAQAQTIEELKASRRNYQEGYEEIERKLRANLNSVAALKDRMRALKKENEELLAAIGQQNDELIAAHQDKKAHLAEIARLKRTIEENQAAIAGWKEGYYEIERENTELRDQLRAQSRKISKLEGTIESLEANERELIAKLDDLHLEHAELLAAYEKQGRENADLRARSEETEGQVRELSRRNAELEDTLHQAGVVGSALVERLQLSESAHAESEKLLANSEKARKLAEKDLQVSREENGVLTARNSSLESEIETLKRQLAEQTALATAEKAERIKQELLVAGLTQAAERREAKVREEQAQHDHLVESLTAERMAQAQLLATAERSLEEQSAASLAALRAKDLIIVRVEGERDDATVRVEELTRTNEGQSVQIASLTSTNATLSQQIESLRALISDRDSEIERQRQALLALETEKAEAVSDLTKELERLRAELADKEAANESLRRELLELRRQLNEAEVVNTRLKDKIRLHERNEKTRSAEIVALQEQLREAQTDLQERKAEFASAFAAKERDLSRLSSERDSLASSLELMQAQSEDLRRANASLTSQNGELSAQNAAQLEELARNNASLSELRSALLAPNSQSRKQMTDEERLSLQMQLAAEALSGMKSFELSGLNPQQIRCIQIIQLLLNLELDCRKTKLITDGSQSALGTEFVSGFQSPVLEGVIDASKTNQDPRNQITVTKLQKVLTSLPDSSKQTIQTFMRQLEGIQSPLLQARNTTVASGIQASSLAFATSQGSPLARLLDFSKIDKSQPRAEKLVALEAELSRLKETVSNASDLAKVEEKEKEVFQEQLKLNIIDICLGDHPFFVKELINLKLALNRFPHGEIERSLTLSRLDKATRDSLLALRHIFNKVTVN